MLNKNKLRKKYIYPNSNIWTGFKHDYYTITIVNNIHANSAFLLKSYKYSESKPIFKCQRLPYSCHHTSSFAIIFSNIYLDFYYNDFIIFPEPKDILIQQHYTTNIS